MLGKAHSDLILCISQLLLARGASTEAVNARGDTAVALADKKKHENVIHIFQDAGDGSTFSPQVQACNTINNIDAKYLTFLKLDIFLFFDVIFPKLLTNIDLIFVTGAKI